MTRKDRPAIPESMCKRSDFVHDMSNAEANGIAAIITLGMMTVSLLKRAPHITSAYRSPSDIEGLMAIIGCTHVTPDTCHEITEALVNGREIPEDYFEAYVKWVLGDADEMDEAARKNPQMHTVGMTDLLKELERRLRGDVAPEDDVDIAVFQLGSEDTPAPAEPSPTE